MMRMFMTKLCFKNLHASMFYPRVLTRFLSTTPAGCGRYGKPYSLLDSLDLIQGP